jgi:Na+/H+ antiporter NhaD/arsenite permease-like protein
MPSLRRALVVLVAVFLMAVPEAAVATTEFGATPDVKLDGSLFSLIWGLPFVGMLLSIAFLPLLAPHFWHHHFGLVSAFWALSFLAPFLFHFGLDLTVYEVLHVLLHEYIPFIFILVTLYTVAGGVKVDGSVRGTPLSNTAFIAAGTALASWMGTTGASMLLIRPVIRANLARRYRIHVIIFFMFLVSNIGGALTPLGDPPLFIGFLKGVDFFWPTRHLVAPMLILTVSLLILFFLLDTYLLKREGGLPPSSGPKRPLRVHGWPNIALLGCVVAVILMNGTWRPGIAFQVADVRVDLEDIVRDGLLLLITLVSYFFTNRQNRIDNQFHWLPIIEVAKLFAGIFVTIVPVLAILRAEERGALAVVIDLVSDDAGQPIPAAYFWVTGVLSSFLDNAPTYLVFFNVAGGDAEALMGPLAGTLLAISAGAVFMGANSYIGNAPNFMVKAIADDAGIPMPSFFGYMAWSVSILGPLFLLITALFFW